MVQNQGDAEKPREDGLDQQNRANHLTVQDRICNSTHLSYIGAGPGQ